MADRITSDFAVGLVFGLLGSINKPKYRKSKPSGSKASEYVVINALPINAEVMQKCIINVNYHLKDIEPGVPDLAKIEAGSVSILAILTKVTTSAYLIDYEGQETIREEQLGEHYSNLRFSFKYINY